MSRGLTLPAVPELAEVEYYRKQWDGGLRRRVEAVQLHARKRIFRGASTRAIVRELSGSRLVQSTVRGKQMVFRFSGGSWLGIHLGMSGTLRCEAAGFRPLKHDHLVLQQSKRALIFRDPRQFGRVRFHHGDAAPDWWREAAPEISASAFNIRYVSAFLDRHRRAPIKAVLLLQSGFPGIGNWMADEILWRARIAPATCSGDLTAEQQAALRRAVRFVSSEALRTIGHDNADPPKSWLIHRRWRPGGVCPRDGSALARGTIGGRTTAWCPNCQRH